MGEGGQLHAPAALPGERLPVPTKLRFCGPQSGSALFGEDIHLLAWLGIEKRSHLCPARLTGNPDTAEIYTDIIFIIFNLHIVSDFSIFNSSLSPALVT